MVMYSLCLLAACLVLTNGWILQHPRTLRDQESQISQESSRNPVECDDLDECVQPLPDRPREMFASNGSLILDCRKETLALEKECAKSMVDCQSGPMSRQYGIWNIVKNNICEKREVFESGRLCWNEMESTPPRELRACHYCGEWTCFRDALIGSPCTEEHFRFMAKLNRELVININGHC